MAESELLLTPSKTVPTRAHSEQPSVPLSQTPISIIPVQVLRNNLPDYKTYWLDVLFSLEVHLIEEKT